MSEDLGSIYIEIELEVKRLLDGVDEVNRKLNELPEAANNAASSLDDTEQSADTLNTGLGKLAATIKAVIAASALKQMAEMVQKHQEYAERVRMATSSQAEFNEVQERLLKTANGTFRALSEAQELYITTAASLRSMGYTTNQAVDVQDSMSYAFVKNATSADKATSAISAFSKAINTGKVGADQWETITSAIPSVIDDIASASGKTSAQVRALGAAGKLTAKDLTEGLKQSLEANESAATGMSNTLVDATVRMSTAITSLLVEVESGTGVIEAFTGGIISAADSILSFSQDSEGMASTINAGTTALTAMAVVLGARMAGSMKSAGAAKLAYIAASTNQLKADLAAAKASEAAAAQAQRRAAAEVRNAQLDRARLQNTINNNAAARQSIIMSAELSAAHQRERAAKLSLVQANAALAASTAAVGAASKAASVGIKMASGAMAMLGGPVGAVMIAAAALYFWYDSANKAKEEAIKFADSLDGVIEKLGEMTRAQLDATLAKTEGSIIAQEEAISSLKTELSSARDAYAKFTPEAFKYAESIGQGIDFTKRQAEASRNLREKTGDLDSASQRLKSTQEKQSRIQGELSIKVREADVAFDILAQNLKEKFPNASAATIAAMASTIQVIDSLKKKAAEPIGNADSRSSEGDKIILSLEEQNKLLSIKDERLRAVTRAEMEMAKVDSSDEQIENAKLLAGENYDLAKAQQEANSESNKSAKTADVAAQSLAQQQAQLERLNTGYADGSLELAKYDAVQALGANASAQQKAAAEAQAESIWKVQKAVKAAAEEEQKRKQAAQNFTGLQSQSSPVLAVDNQYAIMRQQLVEYAVFNKDKVTEIEAVRASIEAQYRQQRMDAQWQELSQMGLGYDMLTSAVDSLAGNASNAITGLMTGTMSAQDAMRSLGNTILNSAVNSVVQLGVEMLKNFILSQTLGVATQAANAAAATAGGAAALAAWTPAAIAASIATAGAASGTGLTAYQTAQASGMALSVLGGRKNGGPVSAGGVYPVGEGNLPEFLQTQHGLFMIPGDNGKVFSNKDVNGSPTIPKASTGMDRLHQSNTAKDSGGNSQQGNNLPPIINVYQQASGATVDVTTEKGLNAQDVINIVVRNIMDGREISGAVSTHHNAPRRATGSL
ncbi:tape measure protein [Klebsiella sp. BIGb0407]|uniref:tape measure protein n=1 Tax=Klebsiella sp. BIGb0407 TaxID=2940603 RepID=UPI0021678C2B|nr:tape measure protein [Klebsiella sp. BIGb0407]MCS3430019.1 tape measure domain-containing protein [Klebsiella sp. BIGb0407]